jgi:hypothetical protein
VTSRSETTPTTRLPIGVLWPWLAGIVALGVGSKLLRPHVRGLDFGITGVAPNFFMCALFVFAIALWKPPRLRYQIGFALGLIGYEIEQSMSGDVRRTFDYWDMLATVLGLVASHYVLRWLSARHQRAS